jgi:probable rRNA maturation factor
MRTVSPPQKIRFHYLEKDFAFTGRLKLKKFIEYLFKKEKKGLSGLVFIFCSDPYLLEINKTFLKHDYYTDIISFELANSGQPAIGEIYISIDRVRDNARNYKVAFNQELHRVIFHGALHLCGYNDKNHKQIGIMRKMEEKYLRLYFGISRRST